MKLCLIKVAILDECIFDPFHKSGHIPVLFLDKFIPVCNCTYTYYLVPTLRVDLSPPLLNGTSGEDALELLCTATVAEDVTASYQFVWIKDDISIDLPSNRTVVCAYICIITANSVTALYICCYAAYLTVQVTNTYSTSSLTIQATNTNATLDNGIYSCQVTLTISGVDSFNKTSNDSTVIFKGI